MPKKMTPARAGRWRATRQAADKAASKAPAGYKGLGRRLAALRARRCLTIEALAEMVDRSHATVGRWEHGKSAPGVDDVESLARALRCKPNDIVGWSVPSSS